MRRRWHLPTQAWTPYICEAVCHNVVNSFQFIPNSKSISPEHPANRKPKFQIYKSFSTHWAQKKEDIQIRFFLRILIFVKIHQLSVEHLGSHQRVICGCREIVCFSRSNSTLSFLMLSAAPGEVSGPIMRNTCCLTQIENTTRWESDGSWSTHVTSFSNHCPCTERNPVLPHPPGIYSGLKHYPFVSSDH